MWAYTPVIISWLRPLSFSISPAGNDETRCSATSPAPCRRIWRQAIHHLLLFRRTGQARPHISFNSARSSSLCSFGWAVYKPGYCAVCSSRVVPQYSRSLLHHRAVLAPEADKIVLHIMINNAARCGSKAQSTLFCGICETPAVRKPVILE